MNNSVDSSRFASGANWERFLLNLDDDRVAEAKSSLCDRLCVESLSGKRFLDIGSGSGLSNLVARQLGAVVHCFDYNSQSVACTTQLRHRYFPQDPEWVVEQGDALDEAYMRSLGLFDVVYSWGVLHHTGAMWLGIDNAANRVKEGDHL